MSAAVNGKTNISKELKKAEGINRLVVLPFKKSVEIAYKSIKVRFFRSLITTMSLVLAVSFLSFVSVTNDVANGFLATQNPDLRQALVRSKNGLLCFHCWCVWSAS